MLPYEPPPRQRICLALSLERTNEGLAVALFTPSIAKEDYIPMVRALHQFLLDEGVRTLDIQPCPIGQGLFVSLPSWREIVSCLVALVNSVSTMSILLSTMKGLTSEPLRWIEKFG